MSSSFDIVERYGGPVKAELSMIDQDEPTMVLTIIADAPMDAEDVHQWIILPGDFLRAIAEVYDEIFNERQRSDVEEAVDG